MALTSRMNRMVSFRLSDQEYRELLKVCESSDSRNLSDVARMAVHRMLGGAETAVAPVSGLERRIKDLERRVETLAARLDRLAAEET